MSVRGKRRPKPGRRRRAGARTAAVATLACALGVLAILTTVVWTQAQTSTAGTLRFEHELHVPPLLEPRDDGAGRLAFELRARVGSSELRSGSRSETWGFNGAQLGPTLRARRGDRITVRVANDLPVATTVHWHGMHLPARADGGPHGSIEPGRSRTVRWRVDQPAATLWYHPHPHGATEEHVYRGLAGMFILDDAAAGRLDLPDAYGVDDFPVIVQDKRLDGRGRLSFDEDLISPLGRLGDTVLVNGTPDPHLRVTTTAVRLRLLNASTARSYAFGFADGRPLSLVATDGGLLPAALRRRRVQLSPGERAEVVVHVGPGERLVLRSFPPDLGDLGTFDARFSGAHDTLDILQLRAADRLRASPPPARTLVARRVPEDPERVRRFDLSGVSINGRRLHMGRIDEVVEVGTTELWELRNRTGTPHSFHVHGPRFWIDSIDGRPPPPDLRGPKDTVLVAPRTTVRIVTRFDDYVDPTTPYMFHCHLLRHEDRGMMGQLAVVADEGRRTSPRG